MELEKHNIAKRVFFNSVVSYIFAFVFVWTETSTIFRITRWFYSSPTTTELGVVVCSVVCLKILFECILDNANVCYFME